MAPGPPPDPAPPAVILRSKRTQDLGPLPRPEMRSGSQMEESELRKGSQASRLALPHLLWGRASLSYFLPTLDRDVHKTRSASATGEVKTRKIKPKVLLLLFQPTYNCNHTDGSTGTPPQLSPVSWAVALRSPASPQRTAQDTDSVRPRAPRAHSLTQAPSPAGTRVGSLCGTSGVLWMWSHIGPPTGCGGFPPSIYIIPVKTTTDVPGDRQ